MSTIFERTDHADQTDTEAGTDTELEVDTVREEASGPQESLEVRRDAPLSLVVGASAAVLAVAFLLRGVGSGTALDWALCALTAVIAGMHLAAVVDARAPLFVVDTLGVRARRGAEWQGVTWPDVERVEHVARATTLRDGSLSVVTHDGRELAVRLSLSTRLIGADWHEVEEALLDLSGGTVPIVSGVSIQQPVEDDADVPAYDVVSLDDDDDADVSSGEPVDADVDQPFDQTADDPDDPDDTGVPAVSEPVEVAPQRASRPASRREVVLDRPVEHVDQLDPDGEEAGQPIAAETQTVVFGNLLDDAPAAHEQTEPREPVVGRQLTVARERVGISIETLAERTRIRPHVIEAIERDDFEACGGDFYARGHLRTLSRMLGVDATALLAQYDEHYAHAPIDARRVFEAELAGLTGGPAGRQTRGGLNWSVLVAAVMAVVLVWSVARLVMDGPVPLADQPVLNGSPSGRATLSNATTKVPVSLTAATGGARVIVRDGRQQVVFDAQLAFMQTAELSAAPPVRIRTSDGGLLVEVDGVDEGPMGATGQDVERTYVP